MQNSQYYKNKYGIPVNDFEEIKKRDTNCVYCHKKMLFSWDPNNIRNCATFEHLNHKKNWVSIRDYVNKGKPVCEITAICCWDCNTNRKDQSLRDWFKKDYCKEKNINYSAVAKVVKNYIDKYEK
ncbi:MAG: hypothetical protein NTW11_00855 [Candidatus Staskawiczbacteria bacterium]|nr:hypothetical protein [Candidatus Staskawiczbacteria bacterium]